MEEENPNTTIAIQKATKEFLDSLKIIPRETYDEVITRLIKKIKIDD